MKEWQYEALEYLQSKTDRSYDDCATFVDFYWQNKRSNVENLEEFNEWIEEY